ncbi:MAG: class I SAM-dependent methyltransferase [Cyanobacteria bacterium P01_G01_bin.67]
MTTVNLDTNKAETFAERLLDILNHGAIALAMSLGHRTRLFDAMENLTPSTSQQIADAAGLNERYVREWLAIMVTGGVVDYDREEKTYYLPPEHSAFLTRAASSDNIATFAQYIAQLGSVEDRIVECFHLGGGVSYAEFKRFHQIMAEDSGQTIVANLIELVLPLVPGAIDALKKGITLLDVGCGSGKALIRMAKTFPNSQFKGYDFSPEAISNARTEAQQRELSNVRFEVKDAATISEIEQYDLITTFDAVHDQAKPNVVLKNIYRALSPNGFYLMQDIRAKTEVGDNLDHPLAPLLYTVSCMHCMTVSLADGGMGLGTMWGEEKTLEMLQEAGFESIEIEQLDHDIMNNFYIIQKT